MRLLALILSLGVASGCGPERPITPSQSPFYTIVYDASTPGEDTEIMAMHPDGSGLHALTNDEVNESSPSVSADGTWLVYRKWDQGSTTAHLYRKAINDAADVRLNQSTSWEEDPKITRDGAWVYYVSGEDGQPDIWRVDASGLGNSNLTASLDVNVAHVSPSSDGSSFIFLRCPTSFGIPREVWYMNADGTGLTDLYTAGWELSYPAISPNGKKVAYCAYVHDTLGLFVQDIATLSFDSRLYTGRAFAPAWSPDGKYLAFMVEDGQSRLSDIYWIPADGSRPAVDLTNTPDCDERHPSVAQGK